MKCSVPEIAWHNREPVLSVSFQPYSISSTHSGPIRLASGGADSHLLIWYVKYGDDCSVSLEIVSDLSRHQKAINTVRWSPNGEMLASGDDESIIILWRQKTDVDPPPLEQSAEEDRETWLQYKVLRGHLEDIYDISWGPFGNFLVSGSVDNTAFVWDIHKGKTTGVLTDHKGFVQGVSWDPKNQCIATMCSDSVFRLFDINTKKVVSRNSKTTLPVPENHVLHGQAFKLFYDGSLQSYFRRLNYSPDGELIAVPTGFIEYTENGVVSHLNVALIYKRSNLKSPICMLPCGESSSLIVQWSPVIYKLKEDGPSPRIRFPTLTRMVLAVATKSTILIYDTQQSTPLAVLTNMHYTRITDLTWSSNGNLLVASSTDGFCSIIRFSEDELGVIAEEETFKLSLLNKSSDMQVSDMSDINNKENINQDLVTNKAVDINTVTPIKRKEKLITPTSTPKSTPKQKSLSAKKKASTPNVADSDVKNAVLIDETAMEPWSQDAVNSYSKDCSTENMEVVSSNEIVIDDPTEDFKMVFEETENTKNTNNSFDKKQEETIANKSNIKESDMSKNNEKPSDVNMTEIPVNSLEKSVNTFEKESLPKMFPKTPRRVNFITLSSPKNKKKS